MTSKSRWVLGFDASCGRCRAIGAAAQKAARGKLEVLPLADLDVRRWREDSLGADAPWAPTLIRLRGDQIQAWTGPAMGLHLLFHLGPVATIRLFKALGELSDAVHAGKSSDQLPERRTFIRIGTGLGIAVGIALTGKAPALADNGGKARAWVAANKDRLPATYTSFTRHTMPYRRAIYDELAPNIKSRLWTDHLAQFRRSHPNMSAKQREVLAALEAHVSNEDTFRAPTGSAEKDGGRLGSEIMDAFGRNEAIALVGTLGPTDPATSATEEEVVRAASTLMVDCECSTMSSYCPIWCSGVPSCTVSYSGCGFLWQYACNGMCTCGCG